MAPDDRTYTKGHMWVRPAAGLSEVGVTDVLIRRLKPLISLEIPDADDEMQRHTWFGEVEGHRETHQLVLPIEARIVEVNAELVWNLDKLVKDPYEAGWLLKLRLEDQADLEGLLDAQAYDEHCKAQKAAQ